jgi:hypothetical protein
MKALIDADILCYEIPFIAQRKGEDDELILLSEHIVLKILEEKIYNIAEKAQCDDFTLYLSSSDIPNFRYDVATIKPYKGNRKNLEKPYYYNFVRQYMLDEFNPVIAEYIEADDMLRIDQLASGNECVVCGIDKDLNQIVGLHYDWRKDYHYEIDEDGANCWFWCQTLIGDVADNIPGITRFGPKRSIDRLGNLSPDERKDSVSELYEKQYGDDWKRALTEVGQLLHILRSPDDYFDLETY